MIIDKKTLVTVELFSRRVQEDEKLEKMRNYSSRLLHKG
jgi:hypothetical protein